MSHEHALLAPILIGALSLPLHAQTSNWTKQAPLPTAGTIMHVAVRSPLEVWAPGSPMLGDVAEIGHTTDAGASWSLTDLGTGQVNAVFFVDSQHGWAAGNGFRRTVDGGATWVKVNEWGTIYDLFFLDPQRGWACGNGGVAYRTTDGGLTWSGVSTPGGATMRSIWFLDAQNGWSVAIGGRIVRTNDGGQSWSLAWNANAYLCAIQFFDALNGWAIGGDTFLRTTDGGQTWNAASVPSGTWVHGARFFDPQHGIAVGEFGNIVRTTNGGQSWTTIAPIGSGPRLWDVEYGDSQTAVYSGEAGALARSTDGGQTWATIQSGAWGISYDLDVLDAQTAWATFQGGEIALTSNGGQRWERTVVTGFDTYGDLHGISFANALRGWAVGINDTFGGSEGRIARSDDGGHGWSPQLSIPGAEFFGVEAISPQIAIAYGRGLPSGGFLRTSDGGLNWVPGGPSAPSGFRGSHFVDASTGWLVGDRIYKSTDAGQTWVEQAQGNGAMLSAVSFADPLNGWAVGFAKQIYHTSDGGQTWVQQQAGGPQGTAYTDVSAVSPSTAWIVGWYGYVARTTDGGATWQEETPPVTSNASFESVAFLDSESGWIAGNVGIYKRERESCEGLTNGCISVANSTGAPALMSWSGSCTVASNDFTLFAGPVPDQPYVFFFGNNPVQVAFGNGYLCAAGGVHRILPVGHATGNLASRRVDLAFFGLTAGTTVHFQCWFRDPAGGGAFFNLSDRLSATFQ